MRDLSDETRRVLEDLRDRCEDIAHAYRREAEGQSGLAARNSQFATSELWRLRAAALREVLGE